MLAQNLLNGCLLNFQPVKSDVKNQADTVKPSPVKFKDILEGTVTRANYQKGSIEKAVSKNEGSDETGQTIVQKPVSYRDIAVKADISTEKVKVKGEKSETADNTSENMGPLQTPAKPDMIVSCLAQMLGMDPKDIEATLKSLDISPETLTDPSKAGEVAEKLSLVAGLDQKQQQTLATLIQNIVQKVDNTTENIGTVAVNKTAAVPENHEQTLIATGIKDIAITDQTPKSLGFAKIFSNLKQKLDAFTDKLASDPEETLSAISESIEKFLTGFKGKTEEAQMISNVSVQNTENAVKPVIEEKEASSKEQVKVSTVKEETSNTQKDTQPVAAQESEGTAEIAVQTVSQPAVQQVESKVVLKPETVIQDAPVSKHEILGQVVEKAKVLLNDGKSEMVMTLKPDSLGKLSLKVVTENGIVMAKFEAESQQVKQVLETNMQLLKDSLEKQGLTVQGFSVSVNDNRQEYRENRSYSGNPVKNPTIGNAVPVTEVSALSNLKRINPYESTGISSINLTA